MGVGTRESLTRLLALTCSLSLALPMANAQTVTSEPAAGGDSLVTLGCELPQILMGDESVMPSNNNPDTKPTGIYLGGGGLALGSLSLMMRLSDVENLKKNKQTVKLLREFIAADDALAQARMDLQQVRIEMQKFISHYNLSQRLGELKAQSIALHGSPSVSHEDLFKDSNVPVSEQARYSSLNIKRATLSASAEQMAKGSEPILKKKVREALEKVKASGRVSFVNHPRIRSLSHYEQAKGKLTDFEARLKENQAQARRLAPWRFAGMAAGGVMVLAGVAYFFYGDEINQWLNSSLDLQQVQDQALISNLRCLANSLDKQEAPLEPVPPGPSATELGKILEQSRSIGLVN